MRIAAQFRSKERLERLKVGAQPLPKLANTTLGTLRLVRVQAQVFHLRNQYPQNHKGWFMYPHDATKVIDGIKSTIDQSKLS